MPKRPDPLAGLSRRQRAQREIDDMRFIRDHAKSIMTASRASVERDLGTSWVGIPGVLERKDFHHAYEPGEQVDAVICARLDLDHSLALPDNQFTDCIGCGANLQHRPDVPPGPKVCICCAAADIRETDKK